jgi:hypothetical protein
VSRLRGIPASAVALVLAALLTPRAAPAQGATSGWEVRFAQSVRTNQDGSMDILRWGEATLALRQAGDSIEGSWTTRIGNPVTWHVSGSMRGDTVAFQATATDSDDPELRQIERIVWEAVVPGDLLEGRMAYHFRGMRRAPSWRPFSGRRTGGQADDSMYGPG